MLRFLDGEIGVIDKGLVNQYDVSIAVCGIALEKVFITSKKSKLPYANKKQKKYCLKKPTHMHEYIYKNKVFGTHLQASRNKDFKGKNASTWRSRIALYLKREYDI